MRKYLTHSLQINAQEIDVSLNRITSADAFLLENSTLKELDLSWNAVGDIGGKALGEALGVNRALQC